jgi:DNA-binding transcriptional ArsR family regulator
LLLGLTNHALTELLILRATVTDDDPVVGITPNRSQLRTAQREAKRFRKDPHQRRKYLSHVRGDGSIIRAALATLEALLQHSNDLADPVWPGQERLAQLAHVSVRTVQRHLRELHEAGYLKVYCSPAKRDRVTGRYYRRKTNRYYFTFCSAPGRGRRVRRNRRSHLDDTDVVMNPLGISNHRPEGGGGGTAVAFDATRWSKSRRSPSQPPPPLPIDRWSDQKGCSDCDFTEWLVGGAGDATRCSCS